jgi:hypothetical protein
VRRAVAAAVILIVVILIALGVHSCQVSQRNSALKDYTNNVGSLIQQSDQTGSQLFNQLQHGSSSNAGNLQNQINETRVSADNELSRGKGLSVPDEMKRAQQNLVLALQMRRDGIANIASDIQPALGTSANRDALNSIAAQMARFYASDAVYKDYTTPLIANALHSAGIAVGGSNGETIESGQFLPSLSWLSPSYVASQIGAKAPAAKRGKVAPGLHGHSLDSVSVGGNTLQTGSTNTIAASPPPTFTLHFTNGGQNTETNVVLKVSVQGTSVSGQKTIPQTTAGESTTGQVTLNSSPPAGSYTVVATVSPVPGEKNSANNTLSFPVTFQ